MKADSFLEENKVEHELIHQDRPTLDCEDAADARDMSTGQIVKSLIVERDGTEYHVCVPGDRELSERKFGEHRMVDPERSKEITGQKSGTVHPFSTDLKHFIDFRLLRNNEVSHTTGSETEAVKMSKESFEDALEAAGFEYEIADIVRSNSRDLEILENRGFEEEDASFISRSGMMQVALESDGDTQMVLEALKEASRQEIVLTLEQLEELMKEAESETHLQKLVEELADKGKISAQDSFDLEEVVDTVLEKNPEALEDLREGKESAMNYLLGKVMQETSGRADPDRTSKLVQERL